MKEHKILVVILGVLLFACMCNRKEPGHYVDPILSDSLRIHQAETIDLDFEVQSDMSNVHIKGGYAGAGSNISFWIYRGKTELYGKNGLSADTFDIVLTEPSNSYYVRFMNSSIIWQYLIEGNIVLEYDVE